MEVIKPNPILDLSFEFSVKVVVFCELLQNNRKYVIANQLLRSGTSIGAQVREAQNSESRADFIHKLKIAAKETAETEYWLLLCKRTMADINVEELLQDCQSINRLLGKIISTSKSKLDSKPVQ